MLARDRHAGRALAWPIFTVLFAVWLAAGAIPSFSQDAASVQVTETTTAATAPEEGGAGEPAQPVAAEPGHLTTPATPAVFVFNHKAHLERGASCGDCHDVTQERTLRMPKMDNCVSCHTVDKNVVGEDCRQCHTITQGKVVPPKWVITPEMPGVRFNHQVHTVKAKLECNACHKGIEQSEKLTSGVMPTMQNCIDCHHQKGQPVQNCRACHTTGLKAIRPRSHKEGNWVLRHGQEVRKGHFGPLVQKCDGCHKQSDCVGCHQENPPRSHTNQFRVRGHGVIAAMDRDKCMACHRQDACIRCHQTVPPQTGPFRHTGAFGSTQNRHCLSCHFSGTVRRTCDTCHKGQPSHLQAPVPPPQIPAHRASDPASNNCRACHRPGAGLTHPDPGFDCRTCHRILP